MNRSSSESHTVFHADHALARRIEGVEAWVQRENAATAALLFPELGADALSVAGGTAAFLGLRSPLSFAAGLGMTGPIAEDEVHQVEEFFRERGMAPRIDVCPLADESLIHLLGSRGYQAVEFTHVLARPLTPHTALPAPPPGITVRRAAPHEDELWARIVNEGFAQRQPFSESERQLGLISFHLPASVCFLAEADGELAGAGAVFSHKGLGALFATSTRPELRRRGVHTALILARLAFLQESGCDLITFYAHPGGDSQRNAERHGFRICYTKLALDGPESR